MPSQQQSRGLTPLNEDSQAQFSSSAFNEEVKRKLHPSQSFESAQNSPKCAKYQDLRYTKFTINGFPGVKHAIFVPDNMTLNVTILEHICMILDKEMPSMLLSGVSSLCHPTKMSTTQLRKCPGFGPLMSEVRSSLGLSKVPADGLKDADVTNKKLVDVVDHVLDKKIASSVSNIANAAFRTNVWTYTGPQISNFEIFLQPSIENGETDAFRMVAAHMQDKSYMESSISKQLMKDLFDNSQVMTGDIVDFFQAVTLPSDLWDQTVNTANPEFAEHGYDYWSFDSLDQKMINGHPITQFPWPHGDLFLLFYREETVTGAAMADVDWEYTTRWKLDAEAVPFLPEALAPMGYVFIGAPYCWQPQMKRKLLHGIKLANPIVVLDNTPNVAKQVAVFVKLIRKVWDKAALSGCKPFLSGERGIVGGNPTSMELIQAMSPAKIMKYIEKEFDSSGMNADERLTLSDIVGLLDLVKRRPQAFKETVCAVDPLADSAEQSVAALMSVFTSHHTGSKELSSTEVHRSLVLKGWDLHLKLVRRATHLRRFATIMAVAIAFLMLVSTSLAMIKVYLTLGQFALPYERILNISLVILPISVLLLMTIQGSFQIAQSWARVHMGASRVVSEIFFFLGNITPYSGTPAANQKRFLKRLRDMVKRLSVSGIREEDLVRSNSGTDQFGNTSAQDLELLQQEVNRVHYGIRPMPWPCRVIRDFLRGTCGGNSWSTLLDGPEMKDLTAPVNAEAYIELRMAPLKKYYSSWVRHISRLRMVLHCTLILVLSVSVGLGATDFSIWIPVSLGIATFVTTLSQWLTPPEISGAVNNALTTLHKLDLRWQGSDIRENRSEGTKHRLVTVTEAMVLAVERAASRATAVPEVDDQEEEEDPEERNEDIIEGRREQRSRPISVAATPLNAGSGAVTPLNGGAAYNGGRR